jgi:hypothetical protein
MKHPISSKLMGKGRANLLLLFPINMKKIQANINRMDNLLVLTPKQKTQEIQHQKAISLG